MHLDIYTVSTKYLHSTYTISTYHIYTLSTISTQDSQEQELEEGVHDAASSVCDGSVTGGDVVTRDSRDMSRSVTATPTSRYYLVTQTTCCSGARVLLTAECGGRCPCATTRPSPCPPPPGWHQWPRGWGNSFHLRRQSEDDEERS